MNIGSRVKGQGSRGFFLYAVIFLPLAACFLTLILSGCGYTNRSLIAPDAKTIFVQTFANKIDITTEPSTRQKYNAYKPFLETKITNVIINRFLYDGNLKVADMQSADLLLEGELVSYLRQPLRYSDAKDIQEYRLNIIVNFKLKDLRTDKVVLEERNLTGDTTYFVTGKSAKTEDSAIDTLLEDLARRLVNRIVHSWQ